MQNIKLLDMKGILTIVILVSLLATSQAQDSTGVKLHKDARVDVLVKKQIEANEYATRESRRFVQGYRILLINTNDRNKANEAKAQVYKSAPELRVYMDYQAPFFKVKVGNYKDAGEANEALKQVQRFYKGSAYVIRDLIEVNPDKSASLE